jgi:hypothetical protein
MITFDNIRFYNQPTKTNRQLVGVDINLNNIIYDWKVYVPAGVDLGQYLQDNSSVYEADILRKEEIWVTYPKTETIIDPITGEPITIDIPKERVVHPDIPDYLENQISDAYNLIETLKRLISKLSDPIINDENITQQDIDDLAIVYPYYEINKSYIIGDIFAFEGKLYEVNQSHTSQADWYPPTTPALYKIKTPPGVIAEWIQPTGAQDAYNIGDKVLHNGYTWESTINANVWEPGVYGWNQIS